MSDYPVVPIDSMSILESHYEDKDGNVYSALKLIEKSKEYKEFDLPLAAIYTDILPFEVNDLEDFLYQMKRVENTDLQYPIILDRHGVIADGWHRVTKAIYHGLTTIKAIRLEEMPPVDSIVEKDAPD